MIAVSTDTIVAKSNTRESGVKTEGSGCPARPRTSRARKPVAHWPNAIPAAPPMNCERQTLDQPLLDQSSGRRAERETNAHIARLSGAARDQQVRNVGARHQQNERHQAVNTYSASE